MPTTVILFGTPYFTIPVLTGLLSMKGLKVIGIVSAQGPMKLIGIDYGIKVYQPETLKNENFLEMFKGLKPDICIVAAYGKIIPKEYLDIPKYGFLNVHPSLLPKYRGPSPCQYAILNGDEETGVTIMKVDEELDHGDIIANSKIGIKNLKLNSGELCENLFKTGAELLVRTLPDYIAGKIKSIPQEHKKATYTKKLTFQEGKIDWSQTAEKIDCFIRAFNPEPGAWTKLPNGKILKIIEIEVEPQKNTKRSTAQKIIFKNKKFLIATRNKFISIKKLQLEGGKTLEAQDFINGYKNLNNQKLY